MVTEIRNRVRYSPQRYAELMAGRRLIAADRWEQVTSLDDVVIGPATALEIRWPQSAQ